MYRYAIIGFGGLGKLHLGNLIKLEKERGDIKLCALCGADPESFKSNVKLNIGNVDISSIDFSSCGFYQDYKELIDKEKPDFILSTLPTYLHEEVAVYALSHGVHVFSEKPMALSAESCRNMIDTARKNNKALMIGQCLRFDPSYREIKKYIDDNYSDCSLSLGRIGAELSYSPKYISSSFKRPSAWMPARVTLKLRPT